MKTIPVSQAKIENGKVVVTSTVNINPANCEFFIFDPSHYRKDGSCLCNNAEHCKFMIKVWGYTKKNFANIPLKD